MSDLDYEILALQLGLGNCDYLLDRTIRGYIECDGMSYGEAKNNAYRQLIIETYRDLKTRVDIMENKVDVMWEWYTLNSMEK